MHLWPSNTTSGPQQPDFTKLRLRQGDNPPGRGWIMRYQNSIRFTDWAMIRLFQDLEVMDGQGRTRKVPIIMGSQERAVAAILGPNVRMDGSGVVDRIRLPMLALWPLDINLDETRFAYPLAIQWDIRDPRYRTAKSRNDLILGRSRGIPITRTYTLYAWSKYQETMNQIVEQVLHKFRPTANLKVEGIDFEAPAYLETIANTGSIDAPDSEDRPVKTEFALRIESMIANTWITEKTAKRLRLSFAVSREGVVDVATADAESFLDGFTDETPSESLEPL